MKCEDCPMTKRKHISVGNLLICDNPRSMNYGDRVGGTMKCLPQKKKEDQSHAKQPKISNNQPEI